MSSRTVGWDIGGAHVKAAVLDDCGYVIDVVQRPCPLWKDLTCLHTVMADLIERVDRPGARHALTMTGELADLFDSRMEGVEQLLAAMFVHLQQNNVYVYVGERGLLDIRSVRPGHYPLIASANWLASAMFTATRVRCGVFVDVGSTTTDIIRVDSNRAIPLGYTDFERLCSRELVYSGVVRTAVSALVHEVEFEGNSVPVVAEQFAVAADIYRLTGELPGTADFWPAVDGGSRDLEGSARRLARMIGCDLDFAPVDQWRKLAEAVKEQQLASIQVAVSLQLSRSPGKPMCLIGAGSGRFLVEQISHRLGLEYLDFSSLLENVGENSASADCASAVATAKLLFKQLADAVAG